jgi:DNA-binding NarL/FixJ family response regulator
MKAHRPIRVVVADDHRLFRQGLCVLLGHSREVEVVGEAGNGEEAVLRVREKRPDVLLLDLDMPVLDGISVTRILARTPDRPKIVLLSSYEDDARVRSAMQAGAAGYVAKRVDAQELIMILKAIVSGVVPVSPFLANLALAPKVAQAPASHLTAKEHEVLQFLAAGHSNSEIARRAYMSTDTVKAYLKSMFEKLQVRNRTQAAVAALEMGLVTRSQAPQPGGARPASPDRPTG